MKICVIGSNSFSGSHFVDHCLTEGHEVLGVSRSKEPNDAFLPYKQNSNLSSFYFRKVDINHGLGDFERIAKAFRPGLVVNFSAQSMVGQSWEVPEDWYSTNIVALAKLINIVGGLGSLERYVHVTTPEVYGSTPDWIKEGEVFNPSTPYAVSRAAGDMHLRIMAKFKKFPVIFTRAANVYGPGQQLYRVIPKALLSAKLDKPFPLHGGGTSRRSFIHIRDVACATLAIAKNGQLGSDYHISTNELVTIRKVVQDAFHLYDRQLELDQSLVEDRLGKDAGYFLDSSKIRGELGWNPLISLEEGMLETKSWVDKNIDVFKGMSWDYVHKS
jgi:dTDP-glucose 4,6-dehydratase